MQRRAHSCPRREAPNNTVGEGLDPPFAQAPLDALREGRVKTRPYDQGKWCKEE